MTDTFRALCAELVATWDKDYPWDHVDDPDIMGALLDSARAALAQPEPVAPTLKEVSDWILLEKKKGARWATATDHHEALPIACAAMHHALTRWGNYPVKPDSSPANPISEENLNG
jgi:hypothetical protein